MVRKGIVIACGVVALHASPVVAQVCAPFNDVPASDTFCGNIQWMFNRAITLGCAVNQYCPADFVRRDQMAAFMNRLGNVTFQQGGNAFGATARLGTVDNNPLDLVTNGQRAIRFSSGSLVGFGSGLVSIEAAHQSNSVARNCVPISACLGSDPPYGSSVLGGGTTAFPNRATDSFGTVGGGLGNRSGNNNADSSDAAFAVVGGGQLNVASGYGSMVGGGQDNHAPGFYASVPGGLENIASGYGSFAAGRQAKATTDGSFIWADGRGFDFAPSVPHFFGARATGGVGFTVAIDADTGAVTQYCNLLPGVASWQCVSDREAKENFEPVAASAVLESLVAMPLFSWNFKGSDPSLRMLGPTAQDFQAAFGLGTDGKTIATVNLDGVALAAIQGLNGKLDAALREKDARIAALEQRASEVEALRAELHVLRAMIAALAPGADSSRRADLSR
jgi:hypothetical protein